MQSSFSLKLLLITPLILGASYKNSAYAESIMENNVEINSINSKIETLNLEKKINKSLFLPELSINTGLGSEKIIDKSNETEKGPYLFLDGKINLYRGKRDSITLSKTELQLVITKIEKEIKSRSLNIESFKLVTEINNLIKENQLIDEELKSNKTELAMARKKVDAGLTTSVDLLDFELKNENLSNEQEKNILKKEEIEKELFNFFGGNIPIQSLVAKYSTNSQLVSTISSSNFDESPSILLANKQIELSDLNKKTYEAEYMPTVDLESKWGQITPGDKFLNSDKREHQVALNINIPLFTGFNTSGKIQQAVIEVTNAKRQKMQLDIENKTKSDIQIKKIDLFKRILASLDRSTIQAKKYRELTIGEYKRGIKNSPDVISASDKLLELQRKTIEAKSDLMIAIYSYNEIFKPYKDE